MQHYVGIYEVNVYHVYKYKSRNYVEIILEPILKKWTRKINICTKGLIKFAKWEFSQQLFIYLFTLLLLLIVQNVLIKEFGFLHFKINLNSIQQNRFLAKLGSKNSVYFMPNEIMHLQSTRVKTKSFKSCERWWMMNNEEWWFQEVEGFCWQCESHLNAYWAKRSCTEILPTLGDRKNLTSGVCQWMDFPHLK